MSCCFLAVLNVFSHHRVLYNSIVHAFPVLAFVIVKCSAAIKSEVPSMYQALQIPAELTQTYKDADAGAKVTKFLACAQPLISVAIIITKNHEWTPQEAWERGDLVENLTLSLAPFASNIIPRDATSLAAEGLSNLAISATNSLSDALQTKINARASGGENILLIGLQALALKLLPTALPRLKQVLKTGSRSATEDNLARVTGETDNLAYAIVAAHQMVYCLKQV